jgi:hypothetical protein
MKTRQWWSGRLYRFEVKDIAFEKLVRSVLAKIPSADAEEFPEAFAILQCHLDSSLGAVEDEKVKLDVDKMNRRQFENDVKIGVIAHELGHLYFAHLDASWSDEEHREMEEEADEKASEWGFEKEIKIMRHIARNRKIQVD